MSLEEAQLLIDAGEFEAGSMLPKIQAAINYLNKIPTGSVLITSLSSVSEAIRGKAGTLITK